MWNNPFLKLLSLYLVFAMFLLALPVQGWAMFIPAGQTASVRQADMDIIQKTLESNLVKQRLMDFGLSSDDAMVRLSRLSNEQIHQLATNLDSLQAGADDGLGVLIFLVLVAIIVVVIIEATGHTVIIRK
jgi:Flp pilus assembly protein TadB